MEPQNYEGDDQRAEAVQEAYQGFEETDHQRHLGLGQSNLLAVCFRRLDALRLPGFNGPDSAVLLWFYWYVACAKLRYFCHWKLYP